MLGGEDNSPPLIVLIMTIKEKQEALNSLKDDKYFEVDKFLFISLFPRSPLNRELLRVNNYNKSRLHSNILYQLLSKCSKEDILKARMGQEPTKQSDQASAEQSGQEPTKQSDQASAEQSGQEPTEQSSQEPTADLIEELQSENEELKSENEELQSENEELKSENEELQEELKVPKSKKKGKKKSTPK